MERTALTENALPFASDPTYLDEEFRWLKVRVSRILAERQLTNAAQEEADGDPAFLHRPGREDSRQLRCRVWELTKQEEQLRQGIDTRLELNRATRDALTLELDVICKEHDLSTEERLILLTALPFGIAQTMAEDVLQDLAKHWGSISVEDAISVLDPRCVGDWQRYRAIFRSHAPLVQHGLIEIEKASGTVGPDSLPSADFRLSLEAFARITGDPEAITEGE